MEGQHYGKPSAWKKLRLRFDWDFSGKLLVYSVVVGFLVGLLATSAYTGFLCLNSTIRGVYSTAGIELPRAEDYTDRTGPLPGEAFLDVERKDVYLGGVVFPRYWILIILVPAFGGLLCGIVVWCFAPEASGEGIDSVIRTFHFRNGIIRNRIPTVKILASFLTLGSGGSAGWEGPTTLLGAGVASTMSKKFGLNVKDRRVLLLCGAAGGIGAIFQIPIGGALYAVEILYASTALELSAFLPCVLASIVGYSTFRLFHGEMRPLDIPETVGLHQPGDLLFFLVFVPLIAVFGLLFVRIVLETRNRIFRRLPIPEFCKPALGGALLGCIALTYPQVLGGGYEWMHRLLEGQLPFLLILCLIVPKMLATALTVSSGGSGGLLAPSLFIGGLLGGSLGHLTSMVLHLLGQPGMAPDVTTCAIVGMATFYAGIGKVPLAAAVIVCEMIGFDYTLLVPLLLLSLLHVAIQSPSMSLYEEQVLAPIDSEAHFGNYSVDLLKAISVREVCRIDLQSEKRPLTIPVDATIPDTARLIASRPDSLFPVLDRQDRFLGVLQASDLWAVFRTRRKWDKLSAGSLTQTMDIAIEPGDNLYKALRLCTLWQISELPVIDPATPEKLLDVLHHHEIIAAYNNRLARSKWD